jgi:hypothetical protein
MLFSGSHRQADATLRAMKHVATAGGDRALTDPDRVALAAAHHIVFRGRDDLDPDALPDIDPDGLAAALEGDTTDAQHCAAFLAVMATVDGVVDAERIASATGYVDALGLDEPYLRDLGDLAHHRLAEVRADIGRRNVRSFTGTWLDEGIDAWLMVYRDHPDPQLHERYETLASCAPGTFGRAFHDFYLLNGFAYPGVPESANEQFTTPHDSAHVLSGYDTSLQGELLVSTFTAGMHPDDAMTAHILPVIISWHLGIELADFAGSSTGSLQPRKFWVAWDRGDHLTGDTLALDWDFWAQTELPLDEVRASMSVPRLDPADAADGKYPDWYKPTA